MDGLEPEGAEGSAQSKGSVQTGHRSSFQPAVTNLRPDKQHQPLRRYNSHHETLPPAAPAIVSDLFEAENSQEHADDPELESTNSDGVQSNFKTATNDYGVFRVYRSGEPSFVPLEDPNKSTSNSPTFQRNAEAMMHDSPTLPPAVNPLNPTETLLMDWYYNGSTTKSFSELNNLVKDVMLRPEFNIDELRDFDASRAAKKLDNVSATTSNSEQDPRLLLTPNDGWIETTVSLSVPPPERGKYGPEAQSPKYSVSGLFYRKPLEIIKAAFGEESAREFHLTPFEEYWQPSGDVPPERIISEVYNSDAFLNEHEKVQSQRRPDCTLESVIAPIMIWSDSTHLSTFGNASLWPIYIYLGNQSKYARGTPSSFAAHHMAYIPKLDDMIQDFYRKEFGTAASAEILTHLRRELMQEIWRLILDDDLMKAYTEGIVLRFPDGVTRRLFIRFFIYAADYPEKVLLACIKYLGNHPCPRCLIEKCHIHELGTKHDFKRRQTLLRVDNQERQNNVELVRKWIYEEGYKINSNAVKGMLDSKSLVPTRSAFSERLLALDVNFYQMFAPDLMHEFELGVWKATFTHLMRILHAQGGDSIQTLNERYRQIPTFGRDTIRKFAKNASAMKQLAARDFEDLLQCSIPAFEGLLDEDNNNILMDLLFELSTFHSLAKLRLHTTTTLNDLEGSTSRLGSMLRRFQSKTCAMFDTRDLPSEEAARGRRRARVNQNRNTSGATKQSKMGKEKKRGTSPTTGKRRLFNLSSYKPHALGDYVQYIRLFGTLDNFSTSLGELEHRRCKRFYPIINRGKFTVGISKHVKRERMLHNIRRRNQSATRGPPPRKKTKHSPKLRQTNLKLTDDEALPDAFPQSHYEMSHETRHPIELATWIGDNEDDPALAGFYDQLKDHLLCRIQARHGDMDDDLIHTDEERLALTIVGGKIYQHKVIRVNYTTYDMRRGQDSLNPRTRANIMLLSREGDHPYWYARVLGVYHVVVQHPTLPEPTMIDFLWVRWYGTDPVRTRRYGWKARRLYRIGFIPHQVDEDTGLSPAFGFVNPLDVIRGVHIIPAFNDGTTDKDLPPSLFARSENEEDLDYNFYYVNFFVDRDMVMRYRGGGVGHKSTRDATDKFLKDRDRKDIARNAVSTPTPATSSSPERDHSESEDNDEDIHTSADDTIAGTAAATAESDSESLLDEEHDYGYGFLIDGMSAETDEEDDDNDWETDDLGPEEGVGDDELDGLGFAEL